MTSLSKTLIAAAAFAAIATAAVSQTANWNFDISMAHYYGGPKNMQLVSMATGIKDHDAMMKHAKKVPTGTILFMSKGELYMTTGSVGANGTITSP